MKASQQRTPAVKYTSETEFLAYFDDTSKRAELKESALNLKGF